MRKIPNPGYDRKPVPVILMLEQKEKAALSARCLIDAFPWVESAEGEDFWMGVYYRLLEISRGEPLK